MLDFSRYAEMMITTRLGIKPIINMTVANLDRKVMRLLK